MERLDIAISTYGPDALRRIAPSSLPQINGVKYVIAWQAHQNAEIPQSLSSRTDISVFRFDNIGLSNNRNNSLLSCTADIVLIADDDISYNPQGIKEAMKFIERNPDTALFTFKIPRPGSPVYPDGEYIFARKYPKNYCVGSCEIALRRSKIGNLRFHPDFGLNSPDMHAGEDELFHLTAMRRGLECRFAPIVIGSHPHAHTGFGKLMTVPTLRAQGCIATLMYPRSFAPRLILKAYSLKRSGQSTFFRSLKYLYGGAFRAFRLLRTDRERLW